MKTLSRSTLLAIAVAAPGAFSAEELEEIVVTADFRQTQLMTSAASVSVLGELQFEERGCAQRCTQRKLVHRSVS